MNTKILEYIIAIAEEKSVSRAAERFYLSHAALSRHLKNIETELGISLFVRERDGMRLTPAGVIFVSDARTILQLERELDQTLTRMRQREKRALFVMVDTPLYNRFLRLVLPRFRAECPGIEVNAVNCNAQQARRALLRGDADLAVYQSLYSQNANLECISLGSSTMRLAFPREHKGPTDLEGLRQALDSGMHLILHPTGSTLRMLQEQILVDHRIYPESILEGNSQNCIQNVSEGGVCGVLAGMYCTREVEKQLRLGSRVATVQQVVAYPRQVSLPPVAHTLIKYMIEAYPGGDGWK